jgi:hypothetical protein
MMKGAGSRLHLGSRFHSAPLFPDLDGLSSYLNWMAESGENLG